MLQIKPQPAINLRLELISKMPVQTTHFAGKAKPIFVNFHSFGHRLTGSSKAGNFGVARGCGRLVVESFGGLGMMIASSGTLNPLKLL